MLVHVLECCAYWYLPTLNKTSRTHLSLAFQSSMAEVLLYRSVFLSSYSFWERQYLGRFETFQVLRNFKRISEMPLLEILSSLIIVRWHIFLVVFLIFILISLELLVMLLDIRIFTIFTKEIGNVAKKYLHIIGGILFDFKTLYTDWYYVIWWKTFCTTTFWGSSHIFLSFRMPTAKHNELVWKWFQQG